MATTTNEDYKLMHALWRKALATGKDGITIPCGSQATATRLRFALYASVRVFRKGMAIPDQQLADAISGIAIGFSPDKCSITMKPKLEQGIMPMLLDLVGKDALKGVDELAAQEAGQAFADRMLKELASPGNDSHEPGSGAATPYYTRS